MIRKLIATTILLVVAVILLSPCVEMDDAVHHHPHHHHVGLSAMSEQAHMPFIGEERDLHAQTTRNGNTVAPHSAMRC